MIQRNENLSSSMYHENKSAPFVFIKGLRSFMYCELRYRMRKLTTGLLTSTQIGIPIRIMHRVHMRMIVKTK
jgi:hypothetical protein